MAPFTQNSLCLFLLILLFHIHLNSSCICPAKHQRQCCYFNAEILTVFIFFDEYQSARYVLFPMVFLLIVGSKLSKTPIHTYYFFSIIRKNTVYAIFLLFNVPYLPIIFLVSWTQPRCSLTCWKLPNSDSFCRITCTRHSIVALCESSVLNCFRENLLRAIEVSTQKYDWVRT